MIVVIFEVEMNDGRGQEYFDLAAALRPEVERIDGFLGVERFESLSTPGRYVSLSFWRDEEAVARWRAHARHQQAQTLGKSGIFKRYRIRVGAILRDYGAEAGERRRGEAATAS